MRPRGKFSHNLCRKKQAYEEPEAEKVNVEFNEEVPALSERTEDHDPAMGD